MGRKGLALAILLGSTAIAAAEGTPYFRLMPINGLNGPGSTPAPTYAEQPAPAAYLAGTAVDGPPPKITNLVPPVTHALVTPGGDITGTLPGLCPGLSFSTGSGSVSGHPVGSCSIPEVRVASTDGAGRKVLSEPFSISVAEPTLSLQGDTAIVAEGATVLIRPVTNIPSPSWTIAGAPPGSSPTFDANGTLRVYAPDVDSPGSYPLTLTATGDGVTRSVAFALGISPVAATVSSPPPAAVHAGGPFQLVARTTATFQGAWQATGDMPLAFASPAAATSQATGTAPANAGSAAVSRRIDYAYVAADAPAGATPAMASGVSSVLVHPALTIQGVSNAYTVAEGQAFSLSPAAAPGSLIGQGAWSQTGLPAPLSFDALTGKVTGRLGGGSVAAGPQSVTLTLRDGGDPGPLGTATASFQLTTAAAVLLSASPTSLTVISQTLPATTGDCSAVTVSNGGSLGATSLVASLDAGNANFRTCAPAATGVPACGGTLASGASCRLGVQLAAATTGNFSGSITVSGDNFAPLSIPFSGSATPPSPSAADTCYTTVYRNGYPQLAFSKPIYANGYTYSASWPSDPYLYGTNARVLGVQRSSTGDQGYTFAEATWYIPRNTPGNRQGSVTDPNTVQIQYFNMGATLPAGGTVTGFPTFNGVSKGPC